MTTELIHETDPRAKRPAPDVTSDWVRRSADLRPDLTGSRMLSLQRLAGNHAVAALIADRAIVRPYATAHPAMSAGGAAIQRCGAVPCDCPADEKAQAAGVARLVDASGWLQRGCDPNMQSCPPGPGGADDDYSSDASRVDSALVAELARIDAQDVSRNGAARPPLATMPLSSAIQSNATYAFAFTPGFVSTAGYTAPEGLLASEALAAQGTAAAQGLVAAQGLTTAGTTVVEGTTLAESLIAGGETILAIEAGGAGEIEAATGPPGWIVGAVVLVVAGAAIGVGYLLLREPAQATTSQSTPAQATPQARRHPNQTCEDATLDALQADKDRICNAIPGESCSASKVSPKKLARRPCSEIRLRIKAMRDCIAIRQRIQDECFGGVPDQVHEDAIQFIQNGIDQCLLLEAINCAPGHPMADK